VIRLREQVEDAGQRLRCNADTSVPHDQYRFIDQPNGWLGETVKPAWPILTNLRLDPFERTGLTGSINFYSWYAFEFWRFVYVQQEVVKFGETFIEFPPIVKWSSSSPMASPLSPW
jgi:hypothetical protein